MHYSLQDYNKKLARFLFGLLAFVATPITTYTLVFIASSMDVVSTYVVGLLMGVVLVAGTTWRVLPDFVAFKRVAGNRRRVKRLNRAVTEFLASWRGRSDAARMNFLYGEYLTIVQSDAHSFELVVHLKDESTIGYRLVPSGIRSLKEMMVTSEEVDRLIEEIELRVRVQRSTLRTVPFRSHATTDAMSFEPGEYPSDEIIMEPSDPSKS